MKPFKLLMRVMTIVSLLSISAFAVTLDTDNFNTTIENWSGGTLVSNKMKIATQGTASKIYTFSGYPNQTVSMTLTVTPNSFSSDSDKIVININGTQVHNSGDGGTLTFNSQLNANGELNVTIKANTNKSSEYVEVDNISIDTVNLAYATSNPRPFTIIYSTNTKGDMKIIGNSILCEKTAAGLCATTVQTDKNNNDLDTLFYKLASDSADTTIFNSTSYTFALPAGVVNSDVLWAGLYWQAGIKGTATDANMTAAQSVKLKAPGAIGYSTITADTTNNRFNWMLNTSSNNAMYYQGVKDITGIVQSAGAGTYQVANIVATAGDKYSPGHFGGWAMVVVYKDANTTLKNITVYDGFDAVNSDHNVTTTLSGFLTPLSGTVNSKFLIFGSEGDRNYDKDKLSITQSSAGGTAYYLKNDGTASTTSGNYNPMNSSITPTGSDTRVPDYENVIGIDIDTYNVGTGAGGLGIITNNQTSTKVTLSTGDDVFNPGVFAFSTDLYQPYMCYQEDIFNSADQNISGVGVQVNTNDILKVRVTVKNMGTDIAKGVQVLHTFDNTKFPYKTGTTSYDNFNSSFVHTQVSPASDSSGNDLFDYDGATYLGKIRVGADANSTDGGQFVTYSSNNQAYAVYEYNATVKQLDQNFSNEYYAAYKSTIDGILDYSNNPVKMELCSGVKNSFWGYSAPEDQGYGDFIDTNITTVALSTAYNTSIDTGSSEGSPVSSSLKFIKTKKAGETVPLTAVYLNSLGVNTDYNNGGKDVDKALWIAIPVLNDITKTGACSATNSAQLQQIIDPSTGKQAVFTIKDTSTTNYSATKNVIIPANASKNAKIEMIVVDTSKLSDNAQNCVAVSSETGNLDGLGQCVNSEVQYVDAYGQTAYDRCAVSTTYGKPCLSQNNGVGTGLFNSSLGCFMCTFYAGTGCSSDNFAIRPNEFNSSLTTGQQFQAGVSSAVAFYANQFGGSGTTDYNESEIASPPSFAVDLNISDSTKTCAQPSLHFDPRVVFSNGLVSDNYKITNVGDFNVTMHEINGSEFALVDVDDTADLQRFITPFTRQIKVIPHHFGLDGNFTNRSNGFTYLSNFEDYNTPESRNISAVLDFNITAQAVDNNTTSNYTELCYAKDGNVTMTLANALVINPVGSLTKMLWYDQNHDINGSIVLGGTTYSMDMNATQFDSVDVNGTAQVKYLINFDRNQTLVVDPMTMTINQVVATDTDLVSGTKVLAANNSANYLYGRIIPRDVRVFGSVPFTVNGWYEVFNAPTIATTNLPASKNDASWYTNTLHNDVSDGDANVTAVVTTTSTTLPVSSISNATGIESYLFNAETPPYGAKAHIDTDPWLWYGETASTYLDPSGVNLNCMTHPCFNINVVPAVGATGSAITGSEANKASKKSTSEAGAGGWKSTSDYAPAVR